MTPAAAAIGSGAIVRVESLCKDFGGPRVLDGVSLELERGHVHSLIGPNGAGKTTLLNILSALYRPTSGRVLIDGHDVGAAPPHALARLGVARTFQNLKICRSLSVLENVLLGAHIGLQGSLWRGIVRPSSLARRDAELVRRAFALLDEVGVPADHHTLREALSYGALKRVELARALMGMPQLLLLDEPAAGLNPREKVDLGRLVGRLAAQHRITVVLVEHDMRLVMGISDHVVVLNYGRCIAAGTPAEVARDPEVVAAYLGGRHSAAVA
uniref:ABC transporter related protein n=1 Tax=uncultured bacterium UPO38 TaxID=1776965 RepID=A0A126SXP6_9BACT|nr:ABC transporter related protein [uncultured bacterium UPO38]